MFVGYQLMGECVLFVDVKLLVLVILWLKVVCVGFNYAEYAYDMVVNVDVFVNLFIFFKLNMVVVGLGDFIQILLVEGCIMYEFELVIVIGKIVKKIFVE